MRKLILSFVLALSLPLSVFAFTQAFAPKPLLDIASSTGTPSTNFIFDASRSTDVQGSTLGLEFRYNYDVGVTDFTGWSKDPKGKFQYSKTGTKTVFLEVRDKTGRISRTTAQVRVTKDPPVRANFSVSPIKGDYTTPFEFTAHIFTRGGQSSNDYEVRWDFEGDGIFDTAFEKSIKATHQFKKSGNITTIMEVRDPAGNTLKVGGYYVDDKDEVGRIVVSPVYEPQGSVVVFPTRGEANITSFKIDASGSLSGGSGSLTYRFDFQNDGTFDTDFSTNPKSSHVFKTGGKKEILVQIKTDSGKTATASTKVVVDDKNSIPIPKLRITSDAYGTDQRTGTLRTVFTFDASGSRDLEDPINKLKARFDFDGDGVFDTPYAETKVVKHTFKTIGEKNVTVEILDVKGNKARATEKVVIVSNDQPTIIFDVSPRVGTPGTEFVFDVSKSYDSQQQRGMLKTRIDYDGDGRFDTEFFPRTFFSHKYDKKGTFKVTVEVQDRYGNSAKKTVQVSTFESTPPVPFFTITPLSGTFNTQFKVNAAQTVDAETPLDQLQFRWDFNYTGANDLTFDTAFARNHQQYRRFDGEPGERRIRLEVRDEEDNRTSVIKKITLHWASPYLQKLFQKGILRGGPNGDMQPDKAVTRAEFTKIIILAAKLRGGFVPYKGIFSDIDRKDWHWIYVERAKELGLIGGYSDGTFRPNQNINRAEALKILLDAFKIKKDAACNAFPDVPIYEWYSSPVCTAVRLKLVKGYSDGRFHPGRSLTRGEVAKIVSMLIKERINPIIY